MKRTPGKKYRVNGKMLSMLQCAKAIGCTYGQFYSRFKSARPWVMRDAQAVAFVFNKGNAWCGVPDLCDDNINPARGR